MDTDEPGWETAADAFQPALGVRAADGRKTMLLRMCPRLSTVSARRQPWNPG